MSIDRQTPGLPHWVYLYWRADGRLLYVGCSARPDKRDRVHRNHSPWYSEVARREVLEPYPDRRAGLRAEAIRILHGRPLYNRALNRNARREDAA